MAFAGVPTYELDLRIGRFSTQIEALQAELLHAATPAKCQTLQTKLTAAVAKRAQLLQIITQRRAQQGGSVTHLRHN